MFLYIAMVQISDETDIEWGVGRNGDDAKANIRMRLMKLNDWSQDEATEYLDFMNIWEVDEIDGYKVKLEQIKK